MERPANSSRTVITQSWLPQRSDVLAYLLKAVKGFQCCFFISHPSKLPGVFCFLCAVVNTNDWCLVLQLHSTQ